MRYLGSKARVARQIADIVRPRGHGIWWEPFCGGLSVSVQLARYGPGVVSDANPALIALYQAVRAGWDPPATATIDEWRYARYTLPSSDPLKAFFGFGCSYGAMWYHGPDVGIRKYWSNRDSCWNKNDAVGATRKALLRDIPLLASCKIEHMDYLTCEIPSGVTTVYCDPPYAGTTGYDVVGPFDHVKFWARCQDLATTGIEVFVSEYICPIPSIELWSRPAGCMVNGTGSGLDPRSPTPSSRIERLFKVLPV